MILKKLLNSCLLVLALALPVFSQENAKAPLSQETDDNGVPVLVKHLPEWEKMREKSTFFTDKTSFESFFKERDITNAVDFIPGTEAVYAEYDEGALLIVEYMTPQATADTNRQIVARSKTTDDKFIYQRIGNYNVFLFDPPDVSKGRQFISQVKYQKIVTWPNGNPMIQFQKEREFILGTKSLFIYTVVFILVGFGLAILIGAIAGITYFKVMEKNRVELNAFSDAGGLTRLNLDGLSADHLKLKE